MQKIFLHLSPLHLQQIYYMILPLSTASVRKYVAKLNAYIHVATQVHVENPSSLWNIHS